MWAKGFKMEIKLEDIYSKNLKVKSIKKQIQYTINDEDRSQYIKNPNNVTTNDLINYKKMTYNRFNELGYAILSYRGAGDEFIGKSSWYQIARINYKCDEGEQILKNLPPSLEIYVRRIEENKHLCYLIQTYLTGRRKITAKNYIYISLNS